MSLDSELLNRQEQETAARELRKQGRLTSKDTTDPKTTDRVADLKKSVRSKILEIKKASMSQGGSMTSGPSAKLLKEAWANLLPSYGLTLIWINIHAFLSISVGRDFFCKLGEEWFPVDLKKSDNRRAQQLAKAVSFLETLFLLILDFLVIAQIVVVIGIIVMIIDAITGGILGIKPGNVFPAWE